MPIYRQSHPLIPLRGRPVDPSAFAADKSIVPLWRRRTSAERLGLWLLGFAITGLSIGTFLKISEKTIWPFVYDAPAQVSDIVSRMFPPEFAYHHVLWKPLWDTFNIATLGTLIAIVLAAPLAVGAASNTSPHPIVRQFCLLLIATSRSINSLIYALLFVAILGPGVLAGICAIGIRSIGFVGKLLYEAIEEIAPEPVEGLVATGASPAQTFAYGVVPQILPAFAGISVFRWDINIRESTVVGLVGAGGIGLQFNGAVNALMWQHASLILLMVFALVVLSEWLSARVRQKFI